MTTYGLDLDKLAAENKVPASGSNRHIHLSPADLEALFGKGYQLNKLKDLSQPGQFAAKECVKIVTEKGEKDSIRILGPVRGKTQIELLASDCHSLGLKVFVRDSGDIAGTPGVEVIGPAGKIRIAEGVIVAARHIHMQTKEAKTFGYKDKDRVSVRFDGPRSATMHNVLIRVHDEYALDLHIDLDEMNACDVKNGDLAQIIR
jgi:putative phosphotransacetylase